MAKTTSEKTASPTKPRLRSKAAKLAFLKRSAAAKAHHHRKRSKRVAHRHLVVFALALFILLTMGSFVVARAVDLIPPPGKDIDISVYEQAAAKRRNQQKAPDQIGVASWYALGLRSPDALTCASTRFPRGTYLEVTDLRNGNKVVCLVNDYGPQPGTKRVVDLSRGSYRQLEGLGSGTTPVEIRVVNGR